MRLASAALILLAGCTARLGRNDEPRATDTSGADGAAREAESRRDGRHRPGGDAGRGDRAPTGDAGRGDRYLQGGDAGAPAFTRVFYDSFEDGTTNKWSADASRAKCKAVTVAADGSAPHTGQYMAECNWNGQVAWNDPASFSNIFLLSWPYQRATLVRFWWRLDKDVDGLDVDVHQCNALKIARIGWNGTPTESDAVWTAWYTLGSGSGYLSEVTWVNEQAAPIADWCGGSTNPFDRQWHEAELYIKHDTGSQDGVISAWFDHKIDAGCGYGGVTAYPFHGTTYNGASGWSTLHLPSNWSTNCSLQPDATNHIYFDDIEVFSDSTTGTPASGSMEDATAAVP